MGPTHTLLSQNMSYLYSTQDVLLERVKANLLESFLEKLIASRDSFELLHQLLDLIHPNKVLLNIANLAVPRVVCILYRRVIKEHILSIRRLKSHSLLVDLL